MNTDLQRQRVANFQRQRDAYLQARQRAIQQHLEPNRRLVSTRHAHLPKLLLAPFVILAIAGALDLLFLLTGNGTWTVVSFALIPAGVFGCLAAGIVGVHDWFAAPAGSRVRGIGTWFAIGVALVLGIFVQSWFARFGVANDEGGLGVVLGFIGASVALMTGWLLGDYLDRLGELKPAATTTNFDVQDVPEPVMVEVDEIVDQRRVAHA